MARQYSALLFAGDSTQFRTAAIYNNDPWWLAASADREAADNQDM